MSHLMQLVTSFMAPALPVQMVAPFAAMLFGSRRYSPMTDNACVSVYAVGPAAAAATEQQRRSINTADEGLTNTSEQAVSNLYALYQRRWPGYCAMLTASLPRHVKSSHEYLMSRGHQA